MGSDERHGLTQEIIEELKRERPIALNARKVGESIAYCHQLA
jgi:hypothetical protein